MSMTPWGESADLRSRRLPPGPAKSSEEVTENQRQRLFGAMVACVAEMGYEGTGVADVSDLAGVSPRSFYQHFESKQACFLATLEAVLSFAVDRILQSPPGRDWREEGRNRFAAFASFVAEQPAAARMFLVEAYTAGPEASELADRAVLQLERAVSDRLEETGLPASMPRELVVAGIAAATGGMRACLLSGQVRRVPEFADQLATFVLEFEPPARPLRVAVRPPERRDEEREAGDHAERALRAFEALLTEHSFAELTMGKVAERAGMSVRTLYANFADRGELMLAAVDGAAAQAAAVMLPAFRRNSSPAEGVRAAFGALYGLLASRPNLAHTLLVGAREGGAAALARRSETLRPIEPLLSAGVPAHQRPISIRIASEALLNAILGLAARRLSESGAGALPGLVSISSFIVLAPVLGPEQATEAAEGKSYRRPAPAVAESLLSANARPVSERVLVALTRGPQSADELADATLFTVEEIEAQLPGLEAAGVVHAVPSEKPSGPTLYQSAWGWIQAEQWESFSQAEREVLSAEIGRVIEAELREAAAAGTFDARTDRTLVRVPVWLDEEGWSELVRNIDAALAETLAIQERASERLTKGGDPDAGSFGRVLLVSFEVPRREEDGD